MQAGVDINNLTTYGLQLTTYDLQLTTYYLLLTTYYLLLTTYYLLLTTYYLQPIGRRQGPTRFLPRTHSGEAGLQPYVEEAATACAGGCSRTW